MNKDPNIAAENALLKDEIASLKEKLKLSAEKNEAYKKKLIAVQARATINPYERLACAKEVFSALGYRGSVMANQLNLVYWRATGEDLLENKLLDDELVSAAELGEIYGLDTPFVNILLKNLGYQYDSYGHWRLTSPGLMAGGRYVDTGKVSPKGKKYRVIRWPKAILGDCELTKI